MGVEASPEAGHRAGRLRGHQHAGLAGPCGLAPLLGLGSLAPVVSARLAISCVALAPRCGARVALVCTLWARLGLAQRCCVACTQDRVTAPHRGAVCMAEQCSRHAGVRSLCRRCRLHIIQATRLPVHHVRAGSHLDSSCRVLPSRPACQGPEVACRELGRLQEVQQAPLQGSRLHHLQVPQDSAGRGRRCALPGGQVSHTAASTPLVQAAHVPRQCIAAVQGVRVLCTART